MNNTAQHAVLFALFQLAKNDRPATVVGLVHETGLGRAVVEASLHALDRAGLANQERVRLTMQGLAAASILGAPRRAANRYLTQRAA
jgi:DNA-binding IclR family transcriptional regulator